MKHMLCLKQTQLLLYTNFKKEKKMSEIAEISGLKWATTTYCRRPGRLHRQPGNSDWGARVFGHLVVRVRDFPEPSGVRGAQLRMDSPTHNLSL